MERIGLKEGCGKNRVNIGGRGVVGEGVGRIGEDVAKLQDSLGSIIVKVP